MALYTTLYMVGLRKFCGEHIEAISFSDAISKAKLLGLTVDGKLVSEIPQKEDGSPDWENRIDYDNIQNN